MSALDGGLLGVIIKSAWLVFLAGRTGRAGLFQNRKRVLRVDKAAKTGGPEKDDGILNFFTTKTREGFSILRQDAENASVRAVEVFGIEIGERRRIKTGLFMAFAG